ncbi:MAG TPA: D-aminoacylase [Candidatus Bathyarchaeia archaeon]
MRKRRLEAARLVYDLAIVNGRIIDGTGNPWYRGDLWIRGDTIAAIGGAKRRADRVIDARGMVVAPGFIDIHSHSDYTILREPRAESKVRQGVTTEVIGNCGNSAAPMSEELQEYRRRYMTAMMGDDQVYTWETMADYMGLVERIGVAFNVATLVGHGTLRQNAVGNEDREPTDGEMAEMVRLLRESMEAGAWGLSTGLIYPPSVYAGTDELVALAGVAAEYGGLYSTHIRGEGDTLIEAVREAVEIGRRAGASVQVSHFKACGSKNWGKTADTLRMVEEVRSEGVDVTFDQYPYTASSTGLTSILPRWVQEGGADRLLERLKDPKVRDRIRAEPTEEMEDWSRLVVVQATKSPGYEGQSIQEIASREGSEPLDSVCDLLVKEGAQVMIVLHEMVEEDVVRVMRSPLGTVGSDGRAVSFGGVFGRSMVHPRFYGTFPRVLGKYVREGVLSLPEAVRKMSGANAQRLGLPDRGLVREGFRADLVVFDPDTVNDEATYTEPHRYPSGIPYVIVNGVPVVENGEHTGAIPGRVLRKTRS